MFHSYVRPNVNASFYLYYVNSRGLATAYYTMRAYKCSRPLNRYSLHCYYSTLTKFPNYLHSEQIRGTITNKIISSHDRFFALLRFNWARMIIIQLFSTIDFTRPASELDNYVRPLIYYVCEHYLSRNLRLYIAEWLYKINVGIQGRPQDLGGGGPRNLVQFWCVLGCILIRFCLYFFQKMPFFI